MDHGSELKSKVKQLIVRQLKLRRREDNLYVAQQHHASAFFARSGSAKNASS
jgi:hypothetical protein